MPVPGLDPGPARPSTPFGSHLAPAARAISLGAMKGGWVYFMSNRRDGVLYVGVTANLSRRVWEHREGLIDGFTRRYGLKWLVYYERFEDIRDAIQREKTIKHWPRAWKVRLIHGMNPEWDDLYETLNQ
jgi:putative endonuclease